MFTSIKKLTTKKRNPVGFPFLLKPMAPDLCHSLVSLFNLALVKACLVIDYWLCLHAGQYIIV